MSNAPIRKDDSADDEPVVDWSKAKRVTRPLKGKARLPLHAIRAGVGKTQVDVAQALGIDQGAVSRIESRDDSKVSTLRRYAEAIGGRYEGAIVFPAGHRIVIAEEEG